MRVLITRAEADARALAAELAAQGHESLVEPLLTIVATAQAPPDLEGIQALAFTSANGVRVFAGLSAHRDLPVFAVGASTAAAARGAGFRRVESAAGDVTALAALITQRLAPEDGAVFHGAGRQVAGDLKGELEAAGFAVRRAVLYEARAATALSPAAAEALAAGKLDAVLFFSPRTAETFVRLVSQAGLAESCRACRAVCLSRAVANKLEAIAWGAVHVADQPTREALLACLAGARGSSAVKERTGKSGRGTH